jgi:ribonuclease P protein subunit POP4
MGLGTLIYHCEAHLQKNATFLTIHIPTTRSHQLAASMADTKELPFGQALLERAFSPDTAATHYTERMLKRPLTIRATSPTPSVRALRRRTLNERKEKTRKQSKQKPRPLTAAQKRKLCLNEIPKEQQKYSIYEPLHNLWLGYMREILSVNDVKRPVYLTPASSGQMLASADMHGALLRIVRSRCASRVGLEGIVVRDTRFTFEIITKHNVVKGRSTYRRYVLLKI